MRILSWNVNGIRSVYSKGFLQWLSRENPDILCIQEIKANTEDVPQEIKDAGYHTYWFSAKKKGYSGTAILSKQEPKISFGIGNKELDDEGRVIIAEYPEFTLLNLYFPHGARDKSKLPHKLSMYKALFENIPKGNVLLCGDFNIAHTELDLARPEQNKGNTMFTPEERQQIDKLVDLGFVDTFRQSHKDTGHYTWWPYYRNARERNLGWRIDYIFSNFEVKDAFILPTVTGSDHCPIGVHCSVFHIP